jgi:hypothetical protein
MPQMLTSVLPIFSAINQFSLAGKEKSIMDQQIYYSKHPEAISAVAAKLQQPLSQGLTQGVGNVVNADLAEQGLSQAPGIQSQVLSQALAPAQLQEQQMALQAALQAIGLPASALQSIQSVMGQPNAIGGIGGIGGSGGGSNPLAFLQAMFNPGSLSGDNDPGITLSSGGSGGGGGSGSGDLASLLAG